mmetsp:Transcript_110897/g.254143  ORF Transcript_110897/g.254143 Transcript_110897/m.254143 type:complete len:223 (-) Transcript_110897:193-861(-)
MDKGRGKGGSAFEPEQPPEPPAEDETEKLKPQEKMLYKVVCMLNLSPDRSLDYGAVCGKLEIKKADLQPLFLQYKGVLAQIRGGLSLRRGVSPPDVLRQLLGGGPPPRPADPPQQDRHGGDRDGRDDRGRSRSRGKGGKDWKSGKDKGGGRGRPQHRVDNEPIVTMRSKDIFFKMHKHLSSDELDDKWAQIKECNWIDVSPEEGRRQAEMRYWELKKTAKRR